ncbi:class I SAM-dependent methyltransferase [Clostridium taeniosporum]|uniref:Class I SAM-dependent methyltransferase n=1 Tax=Clostridium taeniosporum TaxID=394958 RepID=A0A1D7XMF5_9CLOT|nr:class I SAM-dependent methyltransferase [Clostridium taeniosporum]AOR24457.1 class I SAM-dependent methyltransferase [Clostridium taeniosporum]
MNNKNNFKNKSKINFNNQADIYDISGDGKFVAPMYAEIINRIVSLKPKKLLDVGCGTGNILMKLSKNTNIELSGLDISEKMIEVARRNIGTKAELKVGDSEFMPWKNKTFDVILCNASFHHYPNPEKVLMEMRRLLKSSGTLIIGDPTAPLFIRQVLNLLCKNSSGGDYRIYNKNAIKKLLNKYGFNTFDFKKINYKSFVINANIKK